MSNSDKNLVITPNVGSGTSEPTITFSGADASLGAQSLQARIYPTSNGTLSFEGSAGQLFSITNDFGGTVYSVNDVSGLPSIEVFDTGIVRLARYTGRILVGNTADNGIDALQLGLYSSISASNMTLNANASALRYTSTVATGTAPFTVSSTTVVPNLNVDKVDGKDIGTLSAAGGIVYATSTTAIAATSQGTSGQAVISGGTSAPTFQNVSSANSASSIIARDVDGSFIANTINATLFSGSGASLTSLNGSNVSSGTIANARTTASSSNGASTIVARDVNGDFAGRTITATTFSGSGASLTTISASSISTGTLDNARTTAASANGASTIVARDVDGSFSANTINATTLSGNANASIITSGTIATDRLGAGTANSSTYLRGDQTWAEIIFPSGQTSGSSSTGYLQYSGVSVANGQINGSTTDPTNTLRLNYEGYLYATRYYTSNIYDFVGEAGTPTIYPDVTTGSVSVANGLTTGTLNLGATGVGAKTVNIGTSTGTTVVWGSTIRLPNAGTPAIGKYLQSDASGNATWQTVVAGATIFDDTTTNSNVYYPGMANTTSGAWTAATVSSTKLYFNPSTGTLNSTNFNSLSDINYKEEITQIENAVSTVLKLNGVNFKWKENGKKSYGVIAQELEKILPELVSGDVVKTVNYSGIIAFLINAIKELDARLTQIESC